MFGVRVHVVLYRNMYSEETPGWSTMTRERTGGMCIDIARTLALL
jgi:hypothetical protein